MSLIPRLTIPLLLALFLPAALPAAPQEPSPDLSQRHRAWLEEVAVLMTPEEREVFLALKKDYQREAFMRRFWEVRDPFPQTALNELQQRWQDRARKARERFGGDLTGDQARMMLINGEPAEVLKVSCDILFPLEIWSYPGSDRVRGDFSLTFRGASPKGPFFLWSPADGIERLFTLDTQARATDPAVALGAIAEICPRGEDISARIGESLDWRKVEQNVQLLPKAGQEWLSSFATYSTDLPAGAATFPAQLDVTYPGRYGSRTVMQGMVSVPREAVKTERIEGSSTATYSFLVDGEVLYKGELFEHFRYRFNLPEGEVASDKIPVVFQRYLRPGAYTLVLKLEDLGGKRFFREQRDLEIPSVASAPAPAVPALAEANAAIGSDEQTIRILPPPPGLITGKVRVEATATGDGVARVRFELNGRPVLTKSRPPYSVELNLGDQPRIHTLRALALAESGDKLAEDEVQLNVGPHRFAVRLVEPQAGRKYQSSLRAQALVEVPEGERLERVEIFLNDDLMATLFQPPFTQPILLPQGKEVTYVRAVAYLEGGNSTEDLVLVNAPENVGSIEVDFVELYTSVVDGKGRPVEGLEQGDFTVVEDGQTQQIRRFELVRDVPVYAGVLLDASSSMAEGNRLDAAVQGALRFFQQVLTPKDRAAVITFADTPTLAVRFTNQEPVLAGGLSGLKADGNTALYDSLVYALYYFGGVKGKRALVVLSDGKDEGSRYTFNDALEYARRSGVAIYTVGIDLSSRDTDVRTKLARLAEDTGGRFFFITGASDLPGVYQAIEKELRSQYLLAYQSSSSGDSDKYRSVEVKVGKPGLEAKTLRGYYP
ncbi:MAG TPA: VWA domain-containing protein [Thermoanaerobaculia bacterium]